MSRDFFRDRLEGGLADDKTNEDFDPEELQKGIQVELEHTNDRDIAAEIARDHLSEDKSYYTKLQKIEGKNEEDPDQEDEEDPKGSKNETPAQSKGQERSPERHSLNTLRNFAKDLYVNYYRSGK